MNRCNFTSLTYKYSFLSSIFLCVGGGSEGATCGYDNSLLLTSTQSLEHVSKHSHTLRTP